MTTQRKRAVRLRLKEEPRDVIPIFVDCQPTDAFEIKLPPGCVMVSISRYPKGEPAPLRATLDGEIRFVSTWTGDVFMVEAIFRDAWTKDGER